jgi:YfiH family protein
MSLQSHQPDQVRYFTSDLLPDDLVTHAIFSRIGGVSQGDFASLNVGLTVGDDPANVYKNREISFREVDRHPESLSDSWLIHGNDAYVYREPRPVSQKTPPQADIVLTDNPEVTLFMRYADCVPIILVDPVRRAIALAHAGWQGTVLKVAQAAVRSMTETYNTRPADVLAVIGPAIGPQHYQVGDEVVGQVEAAVGSDAESLLPNYKQSAHFDLWSANFLALQQAGVTNIDMAGVCTFDRADEWFSHRAAGGNTGRFGVLLALKE